VRGILSAAGYVPKGRLDRTAIRPLVGQGGGKGTRAVASYDEDTTTMGVEAARLTLRSTSTRPTALWFSTVAPAYLDKTNATAIHAALRLDHDVPALDFGGSVRSAAGALQAALCGAGTTLVVSADLRTGLPGSADEAAGGDGAGALLVGDDAEGPLLAEYIGGASATEEFLDRWRTPGDVRSKQWEERFGETKYVALGEQAWREALKTADLDAGSVATAIVTGTHGRAAASLARRLGVAKEAVTDDLSASVGNTGAAHPALLLTRVLEAAEPGQLIALVVLSDGADVMLFRAADALAGFRAARGVDDQLAATLDVPYGKFLAWRGMLPVEPPRRPDPARVSASAAGRSEPWKFGFVGGRDPETGNVQLPPLPDSSGAAPMADAVGTVVTYTVDRMAYSPSPPTVFAVVDFDGGGRFPIELTDVQEADVAIGTRVEMTFRKLFTADGIHNYFWKARPVV
jgi:3-hydroxy-3-methylglutaryl CoA synthase/uncharacterized OB-fold protein